MTNEPNLDGVEMKMPTDNSTQKSNPSTEESTKGMFIVLIGLALVVIGVGIFFWYQSMNNVVSTPANLRPSAEQNNEPESTNAEAEVESMGALSTSDEINAIEADLESTLLNNLDAELLQIEAELQSSFTE